MSSFVLKIVAVLSMSVDHIGYLIFGKFSFFNYIGRLAFPIFAFQISEGYIHTKNLKQYFFRLFMFSLISQIPFMLFRNLVSTDFSLNIFFTLLLGLFCIFIYDKCKYKILAIISSVSIALIAEYSHCDYGFYGVAIILIFYMFKNNFINASIFFLLATLIKYLIPFIQNNFYNAYIYLFVFTSASIIFISAYNGKKGKDSRYLLYLSYPLHLLLIYGISLFLN